MAAGNCRSSTFFAASCALSSRSNRPAHKYTELVITESDDRPFVPFAALPREFFRSGPVSMRGNTSGGTAFAGSGAGGFKCATGFATGAFGSCITGAGGGGGGAGITYAKSGGFGGAAGSGATIRLAVCTTPNQWSPLSAPTTSNAPSKIHTKGEVLRGAGCGIAAAAAAARGRPVEMRFEFVVLAVAGGPAGGTAGAPECRLDSSSAID